MTHQPIVNDPTPTVPVGLTEVTLTGDGMIDSPYVNTATNFYNDSYWSAIQMCGKMEFSAQGGEFSYTVSPLHNIGTAIMPMQRLAVNSTHISNYGMTVIFEVVKHPMVRAIIEVKYNDFWPGVTEAATRNETQRIEWDTSEFKYLAIRFNGYLNKNYRSIMRKRDLKYEGYEGTYKTVSSLTLGHAHLSLISYVQASIAPDTFDVIIHQGLEDFIPQSFRNPIGVVEDNSNEFTTEFTKVQWLN